MKTSYPKTGVIVNCLFAPIHTKPRNDSETILELSALSEVEVLPEKETGDFYYVHILSGDEGYLLKEYIVLR